MLRGRPGAIAILGFTTFTSAAEFRLHTVRGDYTDVHDVRVEGDHIVYQQFGGEVRRPVSDIVRVEPLDAALRDGEAAEDRERQANFEIREAGAEFKEAVKSGDATQIIRATNRPRALVPSCRKEKR
jgi:hypothetical protein